jgi:hypothetical protein
MGAFFPSSPPATMISSGGTPPASKKARLNSSALRDPQERHFERELAESFLEFCAVLIKSPGINQWWSRHRTIFRGGFMNRLEIGGSGDEPLPKRAARRSTTGVQTTLGVPCENRMNTDADRRSQTRMSPDSLLLRVGIAPGLESGSEPHVRAEPRHKIVPRDLAIGEAK